MHFRQIVSSSGGTAGFSFRGGTGGDWITWHNVSKAVTPPNGRQRLEHLERQLGLIEIVPAVTRRLAHQPQLDLVAFSFGCQAANGPLTSS
jgi:hypothetical protein